VPKRPRRLLLLSDIHANWEALTAVLQDARGRYEAIWFLGDIVGYGPWPVECVRFLKTCVGQRWRVGNHELCLAGLIPPEAPFQPTENMQWTNRRHREALQQQPRLWSWFKRVITEKRATPLCRQYGDASLVLAHANLDDYIGTYLYPDDHFNLLNNVRQAEKMGKAPKRKACWIILGHSHMVFLARRASEALELLPIRYGEEIPIGDGAYVINPGSVGQPRDGDRRASYAILDIGKRTVEFRRVGYDVRKVVRELQRQGYPQNLQETLAKGRREGVTWRFEEAYQRVSEEELRPR
jgi:diadenosine tetraphosphatase ApaH/serine/threonine PP2A family protein phosphatase